MQRGSGMSTSQLEKTGIGRLPVNVVSPVARITTGKTHWRNDLEQAAMERRTRVGGMACRRKNKPLHDTGATAMTTPPVTSVTDEMISEFERDVQRVWPDGDSSIITLSALLAERSELKRDAERYRWLRVQHWHDAPLCVVSNPTYSVKLGKDCPSDERLDQKIDQWLYPVQE